MRPLLQTIYYNIKNNWYAQLVLLLIAYVSLFNHLGSAPIHTWDEGVYASNALEMLLRGNFLIKYYDGSPEMWATQPPLAAWIHVTFFLIFGISELAIRIPSAISGLIIIFILIKFFHKEFNIKQIGYFSSLVLLTSSGYISYHVARTADLDAFVTMFSFIYIIYFYRFIKSDLKNKKYLIITLVAIFCAFFTKSIAGLIYLPVLFLFLLYSKKAIRFFKLKELYLTIIILAIIFISYYWIHELKTPGYIKTAFFREITGRFSGTIGDNHPGPFLMFFTNLRDNSFTPWFFLLPISIFFIIIQKTKEFRDFFIYIISLALFYWLVISSSSTKLIWYNAQLYPLLSILVGLCIYYLYDSILIKISPNKIIKIIFFFCFITALFYYPVYNINRKNITEKTGMGPDENYGPTLKKIKDLYPNIKNIDILHIGFSPHVTYYKTLFNKFYGYNITNRSIIEKITFEQNSFILFWHPAVFDVLNKDYNYSVIFQNEEMYLVKVKNRKSAIASFHINDFENLDINNFKKILNTKYYHSGKYSFKIDKLNEFSWLYEFACSDLNEIFNQAIVKGWILSEKTYDGKIVFSIEKEGKAYYWKCLELKNVILEKNVWKEVSQTFEIPKAIPEGYILKVYFWNKSETPLFLDDFSIEFK